MTFEKFWKDESGWWNPNPEHYEGTAEYTLAYDAYQAGMDSAKTLPKIYDGCTVELREYESLVEAINRLCVGGWTLSTVLHKHDRMYYIILEKEEI